MSMEKMIEAEEVCRFGRRGWVGRASLDVFRSIYQKEDSFPGGPCIRKIVIGVEDLGTVGVQKFVPYLLLNVL